MCDLKLTAAETKQIQDARKHEDKLAQANDDYTAMIKAAFSYNSRVDSRDRVAIFFGIDTRALTLVGSGILPPRRLHVL